MPNTVSLDDLGTLAAACVGAGLAPGDNEGQQTASRIHRLVHESFERDGNDFARSALAHVEEHPHDREPQAALAAIVTQKAATDPEFRRSLQELVSAGASEPGLVEAARRIGTRDFEPALARLIET